MNETTKGGGWAPGDLAMTPWDGVEGCVIAIDDGLVVLQDEGGNRYECSVHLLSLDGRIPGRKSLAESASEEQSRLFPDVLHARFQPDYGGILISEQGGFIPSVSELEALLEEFRVFTNAIGPEAIADHNKQAWLRINQRPAALPRPKRIRVPQPGHVYVLRGESGHHKIGRAAKVDRRVTQLATQAPYQVEFIHSFPCADMLAAEKALHAKYAAKRSVGEWFDLTPEDVAWLLSINNWPGE